MVLNWHCDDNFDDLETSIRVFEFGLQQLRIQVFLQLRRAGALREPHSATDIDWSQC